MQLAPERILTCPHPRPRSVKRMALAAAGLTCFGLGAIGVVVPGMPTTVFVLVGSICLTKSCPWLERRLVESRVFRPYAKYLDPTVPMPRRAKVVAIATMWAAIAVSCTLLLLAGAPWYAAAIVAGLGVIGTWVIARFRRQLAQTPRMSVASQEDHRHVPLESGSHTSKPFESDEAELVSAR